MESASDPSVLKSARRIAKLNPATGRLIREYNIASPEQVKAAVQKARQALSAWRAASLSQRAQVLKTALKTIYQQAAQIGAMISEETGKPTADALEGDVGPALSVLGYYAGLGAKRLKPRAIRPDLISLITGRSHWETYHPRGVIAVISPWNYPLAIPASGLAAALMAGNVVVLKPSELTPATGQWLVERFRDALKSHGFSEDAVQCLLGDGATGAALLETEIDGVIFTGSHQTGQRIQQSITGRGIWSSLELGGSDAMLVLEGCNLEAVASYALWGRYTNAGQACASVKRLLVPAHSFEALISHLQEKIAKLQVGPPDQPGYHLGPLISESQLLILESQVQDALLQGARLVTGGGRLPGSGWFYAPTLLADVPATARIFQEEVFGPVLPVIPYETVAEALSLVNDSAFGLTASVFGPARQATAIAAQLECGTVVINDVGPSNYAMPCAPWGGWKNSGSGVSHGERALLDLSRIQVVSVNQFFKWPGLQKPLWHFGRHAHLLPDRSKVVLAFSSGHPLIWHPKTWLAFWQNRASTKI